MKMLLISNMYPSSKYPNYGVFVKNFEEHIAEENIDVEKIVLRKTTYISIKIIKYIIFYLKIFFKCIKNEYNIIYIHYASHSAIPIILANKFKKLKIYVNVHGTDVLPINSKQEKFQKYVSKLLEISSCIIVPSNYYKKIVENKYLLNKEIFISPSGGISQDKFYYIDNKIKLKNELNINNNLQMITGYIGRIDPKKGWDIYIDAINKLQKEGKFENKLAIIVGSGSCIDDMKDRISKYNLNKYILHYDFLPQDKLVTIYNVIDVLCFPSYSESLGLVGLEAMACGVPVIASDIEALTEYVEEGVTGYLFECGNVESLAYCLEKFESLYSMDMKNILKENCIQKSYVYNDKKVKKDLIEFLKRN